MKFTTNFARFCGLALVLTLATTVSTIASPEKKRVELAAGPLGSMPSMPVITITAKRLSATEKTQ